MKRRLFNIVAALSLLLFLAVCVLWVRGWSGADKLSLTYDRYLSDRSAASDQLYLTSNKRIWLTVTHGRVGPYDGNLVWGYHVNANQSGGRPRFHWHRGPYDASQTRTWPSSDPDIGTSGAGPVRWQISTRSTPKDGDDFLYVHLGVSHWLLALILLALPMLWLKRLNQSRRARKLGLCKKCGYDLRASEDRCPECGAAIPAEQGKHSLAADERG